MAAQKPKERILDKSQEGHSDTSKNIEAPIADKSKKKNNTPKAVESSEKPKSKKKLIIIIIVIVVLGGLGAAGFVMKDKIMGMMGKTHPTEKEAPKAKTETKSKVPKAKKDMTPQQVEAILDSMEPKKSTPIDSTKK